MANSAIVAVQSEELNTWNLTINGSFFGVLEQINLGDDDQFVFTDSFKHQTILDVGNVDEALEEICYHIETATRH